MHEMGIAMQIIEIAESSIPENMKHVQIGRVNLKVGKLSAIVPDSLKFCFEIVAKETQFENAELKMEEIPVTACCNKCKTNWTLNEPVFSCPECKSGSVEILTGRELDIVSLEVADK